MSDLISREALKKAIKEDLADGDNSVNLEYCNAMETVLDLIDLAPTVEAFTKEDMAGAYNEGYACGSRENTRPQGEWLEYGDHAWKCSKCNCSVYVRTRSFCPDCGAKMRGGTENGRA